MRAPADAEAGKACGRSHQPSDVVFGGAPPPALLTSSGDWAACVSGALPETEYVDLVKQAGFEQVSTWRAPSYGKLDGVEVYSVYLSAQKPGQAGG